MQTLFIDEGLDEGADDSKLSCVHAFQASPKAAPVHVTCRMSPVTEKLSSATTESIPCRPLPYRANVSCYAEAQISELEHLREFVVPRRSSQY